MIGPIVNPVWQQWAATALAEGRLSWRVTDAQGRPCNGGNAEPIPLGEWSPTIEDAVLCRRGWHTTSDPVRWQGSRVWLVEGDGLVETEHDKMCWRRIRPLAEVDPRQSICQRIQVAAMRPYLAGANLEGAYLARADLRRVDLTGANLAGANFAGAYLAGWERARRLSTAVDRLERESLEVIAALGLHEDTEHEKVLEHIRALVKEHAEMRMVIEGHRHRFQPKSNHHPECDIPMSCQGGCWDLFYGEDLP